MAKLDPYRWINYDVEQSVQSIQESLEVIHANQSNINMAKESFELTQARFKEGMTTTMDIMDSQLALDQALNGYY
jgi:outer membrane protein